MSISSRNNIVIQIKNLWVSLKDRIILEDINLTVWDGDFLGIIGPNGGGKTTLLRVILGLVKPMQGSVQVLGEQVHKTGKHIAYVPQHAHFDQDFPINVWDMVLMGRLGQRRGRFYSREDQAAVKSILLELEIDALGKRQVGKLSGGERQRVLLARALVSRPRILLMDEPTNNIDSQFEARFYDILKKLSQEMTLVLVSHDLTAISRHVNKWACLNRKIVVGGKNDITPEIIAEVYQCSVNRIMHDQFRHIVAAPKGEVFR